jgi:DNA polymerase/3'-5' exonuclease PolX
MDIKTADAVMNHLAELSELYYKQGDEHRAASFKAAAESLETWFELGHDFKTVDDIPKLPKVGASTRQEIKECLETGTSKRLTDLQNQQAEKPETEIDLSVLDSLLG